MKFKKVKESKIMEQPIKRNPQNEEERNVNYEFAVPTYYVEMLFQKQPEILAPNLLKKLQREFQKVVLEADTPDFVVFSFGELNFERETQEKMPRIVLSKNDTKIYLDKLEMAMDQTWDWPDKEEVVRKCNYKILVSDFLAEELDKNHRIELFNKVLKVLLMHMDCSAIHWVSSLKVVSPETYIAAISGKDSTDYLYGALNVRLFVVDQETGEFLMDTMGLAPFGLPDLQCHFKGLNPEDVAGLLINYGYYIFEKGDVIKDGHTIQGLNEEQKWKCIHEYSMAVPQRVVIDLNPGEEFAGGERNDMKEMN
jgi:hypothetical protein